jgi:hypothetical protein
MCTRYVSKGMTGLARLTQLWGVSGGPAPQAGSELDQSKTLEELGITDAMLILKLAS